MAELSDDEIEGLLTGRKGSPNPAPATTTGSSSITSAARANPAPSDQDGPSGALRISVRPAAKGGELSDDEIEAMLSGKGGKPAGPTATADPKPEATPIFDAVGSFLHGATDIPILGPAMTGIATRGGAVIRSMRTGESYGDALAGIQNKVAQVSEDHPVAGFAGHMLSGATALAPAIAAAPEAFGAGGGNMLMRMLAGAGTGGGIGAVDGGIRAGLNSGLDPAEIGAGAAFGGATGFAAGGAAVPLGAALGAGVNKLGAYFRGVANPPAAANVNRLFEAASTTPEAAQASLSRMGPAATLADLDPAFTTEAGALAARGGKSTSVLKGAMANRAAGANDRVARSFDELLGPKPDLTAELSAIEKRASSTAGPFYDLAHENRAPHDLAPIIAGIDKRLETAAGGTADVLDKVKGFLTNRDGSPKTTTPQLHEARQAVDDLLERLPTAVTSAGKNARATLSDVRTKLDAELKSVPGMKAGDNVFAGEMRVRDAMQEGTELFTRKVRPEDFFKRLMSASPQETEALRAGARVAIGDVLEQASRGELAGAKQLFGAGSANRAKLLQLFPKAGKALDALQTEAAMRATERTVAGNSATAERIAAGARYQPPGSGAGLSNDLLAAGQGLALGDPTGGVGTALARRGAGNALTRFMGGKYDRLAEGTAERLAASGAPRDEFLRQLTAANSNKLLGTVAAGGGNALVNAGGYAGRRRYEDRNALLGRR